MDKDRVEGAGKKVAGSLKPAASHATIDTEVAVKGQAEKTTGAVQSTTGKAKDAVHDNIKK